MSALNCDVRPSNDGFNPFRRRRGAEPTDGAGRFAVNDQTARKHRTVKRIRTSRSLARWTLLAAAVFSVLCVMPIPAGAQSIAGHVFEDQGYAGGAGRNFATAGGGVTGARVELYHSGGAYMCAVTTAAGGTYTLNAANGCAVANGNTYTVRVVNGSVISNYTGGGTSGLVPVQTYRTTCTACGANPTAVTNYVGGQNPVNVDPGNNTSGNVPATAQSISTVSITAGQPAASNIDFGFNFFTVVNKNASGQGSLAQFITNANALTGASAPTAIFMLYNGAATPPAGMNTTYTNLLSTLSGGTGQGFIVNMGGVALPNFTAVNGKIDGSNEVTNIGGTNPNTNSVGSNSQCGPAVASGTTKVGTSGTTLQAWTGPTIPVIEIQNCADAEWHLNGSGQTAKALAFHQCTLYVGASNVTVQDNLVGVHADGTMTTAVSGNYGISLSNGSGRNINHNYVRVNDSDIRNDGQGSTGDTYQYNEVTQPTTGQTNTFDGILLIGPGTYSGDIIQYNYAHDLEGGGIEIGFSGTATMASETIQNNTVCSNGWNLTGNAPYTYSSPSAERVNIAIWQVSQGSTVTIKNNIITNSSGVGILIENAYGFTITQNSIYLNGLTSNNLGPGIALFASCSNCDPNTFWTSGYTGVTPNQGTLNPGSPNYQMNYPVFTVTTYSGGKLHVKGYVGGAINLAVANAKVELFVANNTDNNQNGQIFQGDGLNVPHGEGPTFICSFQADSTGNFDLQLPSASVPGCTSFASGVTITAGSTVITSTATDAASGSTSEFGPNSTVLASAITVSGYVYLDVNHDGALNSGESWQNGTQVYVSLWNGATQIGTTQTVPAGSSSDTGFYSFNNLLNSGGTYTIVLSTTATPTGVGSAGVPSGYLLVNPTTATIAFTFTSSTPAVMNQNFGLFHGLKISGKVFNDNGAGTGGVANDGHWNGTEPGFNGVAMVAKDNGSVQLDKTSTDAGGNYTLWLPSTAASPVTITLSAFGTYVSSGFDAGTPATGGTWNTSTLVFSFSPTWTNSAYTGVNFGFVPGNSFAPNGSQEAVPGSIAVYPHIYTSVTGGSVSFTATAAQSQPNYFAEILYKDTACSGNLATATYLAWGTSVTIPSGGGKVCILMKEMVSLAASFGMQNSVTITATFAYGGSSSLPNTTLTVLDVTVLGTRTTGDLQLVKSVYIDATCANPANPTYSTTATSAQSGYCIKYQIQATNGGASPLSGLVISDFTPPYTTLQSGTPASSVGTSCTGLTAGAITVNAGALQAAFSGNMPSGCVATFVYEVKVN